MTYAFYQKFTKLFLNFKSQPLQYLFLVKVSALVVIDLLQTYNTHLSLNPKQNFVHISSNIYLIPKYENHHQFWD